MTNIVHKLFFPKAGGGKTLCGLNVVAFYPMQMYAMTDEAGKANVKVTIFGKPNCEACKRKDKES